MTFIRETHKRSPQQLLLLLIYLSLSCAPDAEVLAAHHPLYEHAVITARGSVVQGIRIKKDGNKFEP